MPYVHVDVADVMDKLSDDELVREVRERGLKVGEVIEESESEYIASLAGDALRAAKSGDVAHCVHQLERIEAYLNHAAPSDVMATYAKALQEKRASA